MSFSTLVTFLNAMIVGALLQPIHSLAAENDCPPRFEALLKYEAIDRSPAPELPALKKVFPHIEAPGDLAVAVRDRHAAWVAAGHPGHELDFPFPEHAPAINWIEARLKKIESNPNIEALDDKTRDFVLTGVEPARQALLSEAQRLKAAGYPYKATLDYAQEATDLFEGLFGNTPNVSNFSALVRKAAAVNVKLPPHEVMRLVALHGRSNNNSTVGEARRVAEKVYFRELTMAFEIAAAKAGAKIDVKKILRESRFEKFPSETYRPSRIFGYNNQHYDPREPTLRILAPGEISIESLNQASLFRIAPLGLIEDEILVDGGVLRPKQFFKHDDGHIIITQSSAMAEALLRLRNSDKSKLLERIRKIETPERRELAHFALNWILRERIRTNEAKFFPESEISARLQTLNRSLEFLGQKPVSESEGRWLLDWIDQTFPDDPSQILARAASW